jgi:triacylglycerol lipase
MLPHASDSGPSRGGGGWSQLFHHAQPALVRLYHRTDPAIFKECSMSQIIGGNDADPNAGLAMTFAAIAYCTDPGTAIGQFAPGWSIAWQADTQINGNLAYIAYNGSSQYVVAIRGSLLDFSWAAFDNWFKQDLNIFEQVAWTFPSSTQSPMISRGSSDGLNDLTSLVETNTVTGATVSMYEFLVANAIPSGASIGVVGHSLGGNLATVYAPWLLYQLQQAGLAVPALLPVLTFAAPTAGNEAFAAAYDSSFPDSWRYYNAIDIVPMSADDIRAAGALYSPAPEASSITVTYKGITVSLAEAVGLIADAIDGSELYYGSYYTQTNRTRGSVVLNDGTAPLLCVLTGTSPVEQWFDQASCQHAGSNYLMLLGYPAVECTKAL